MSAQRQGGTPSGFALLFPYSWAVWKRRLSSLFLQNFYYSNKFYIYYVLFSHKFTCKIVLYNECFYSLLYLSAIYGIIAP